MYYTIGEFCACEMTIFSDFNDHNCTLLDHEVKLFLHAPPPPPPPPPPPQDSSTHVTCRCDHLSEIVVLERCESGYYGENCADGESESILLNVLCNHDLFGM